MRYLKIIIAVLLLAGCEEYFHLDTDATEPIYVFEGLITDQPGPYKVKVTRTNGYNDDKTIEVITNARVRIDCSDGKSYNLIIDNSGYYLSDSASLVGEVGKSYMLFVTTSDGKVFESSWEELLPCPDIEEVSAKYYEEKILSTNGSDYFDETDFGICATNTTNATGFTPYYRYECKIVIQIHQYYPGLFPENRYVYHPVTQQGLLFIANANNYTDNRIVGNQLYKTRKKLFNLTVDTLIPEMPEFILQHRGEYVLVKQYSMTESQYKFWNAVKDQQENSNYLFGQIENQPVGNMSCKSGDRAFGFFGASAVKQNFGAFSLVEKTRNVMIYNIDSFPDTDTVAYYDHPQNYTISFAN